MRYDRELLLWLAGSTRLERAIRRLPWGERAARRAASRFVAGESSVEALATAERLQAAGSSVSVDLFGAMVDDPPAADRVAHEYVTLAAALRRLPASATWLSVDLTHLAVHTDPAGAVDRLETIARALSAGQRLQVGAEDAIYTDAIQECVVKAAGRGLRDRLGATIQANLLRSPVDTERLVAAGLHIRLVKGAYVERTGAHPFGEPTDVAFLRLGHQLRDSGANWSVATHDGRLREALALCGIEVTVEQLLGVRPDVLAELRARGVPTRVYAPYGPAWFRYWARRVAESRGVGVRPRRDQGFVPNP